MAPLEPIRALKIKEYVIENSVYMCIYVYMSSDDPIPNNGHQIVVQHEAFGAQRPTGVAVEDSDDNRHVSAADGGGERDAERRAESGGGAEQSQASGQIVGVEVPAESADVGGEHGRVEDVSTGQEERVGVEQALELAVRDQRARPRDGADERAEEQRALDHARSRIGGQVAVLADVVRDARENGRGAHERVEERDELRQVRDGYATRDYGADQTAQAHRAAHLHGQLRRDVDLTQRGRLKS